MQGFLSSYFQLANNINAGVTQTNSWNSASGFAPVGIGANNFTGNFNGAGYTITNLYINLPGTNYVGLFGYENNEYYRKCGAGGWINGYDYVGALVGDLYNGTISNSYTTGSVRE